MVLSIAAQATVVECSPNKNAIAWWLTQGDTLVLADGEYVEEYSIALNKPGAVIMAAEGAKPVIKASSYLKIHATTTFIGITFDGQNTGEHALTIRDNSAKNLILKDCEIANYPKCLVYCDNGHHVDSLVIDNCLLHNAGRAAVYVATSSLKDGETPIHGCDYFKMTNSTVYDINSTNYSAGAIDIRTNGEKQGDYTEVIVDHVTMYNLKATGDYGAIASYKSTDVKISNTIVMNPEVYTSYSFRIYGGVVDNCLSYNCAGKSGATYNNCIEGEDPLFLNPAAGDFNLQPGSPVIGKATDGTNMGDPRWKVAAAELAFAMAAPAADVEATDLYTIKWTVLDPDGDATIKLEYKAEEGDWTTIAENIPSTKSAYDWNIRQMPAQTVAIRGTLANATKSIVSEAAGKLTIVPEAVAPRPVRNLAGEVAENTLTLTWINPDQAYEVSETLETLESAESYISNDGTAEVTLSGDKKEVSVAYNTTAAWHMAGVKVPVTADYVNTLACELKRDAADGTQIQVTIEQNGFDWWYLIIDDIATEWTEYEFTEFEKLSWHNNSDAAVLDGTNVTAVYFATNHGSGVTGTLSLRNLTLNGAVPAVADYEKTVVCVSEVAYPTTIVAEEVVYEGTVSTCTVEIDPTKDLYVSVFAQDDLGNTSVAAQYKYTAPAVEVVTYTIEGEVLEKNDGRYLTLVAEDETHGDIELNIFGYDGLSESYSISGAIGGVNVEGTCTYTVDKEAGIETLVASVVTDDATVKYEITLVYTIPAAQYYLIMMTEGVEAVSEVFEWEDVDEEGNPVPVRIASYSWHGANEELEVYIEAGENVEGFYAMGSVAYLATGQVAEISVLEEDPVIEEVMGQLSIYGQFTDGLNTYEVYLIGQLPVVEEEGTTKYITVANADIAPGMDNVTDLEIWAEDEDYNTIMIALTEGTTKMYGDYTADELYISYNWEAATLLEETVGTYKLDGEVAVFEATVLCGADTLVLSISGTPWVDPATIVPVETVEMKFYEGTVGYSMGTTKIAGTNAEATLTIGIIGANESNMYDQEWSADDLSWETTLTIADKEVAFIYGTVTIKKDGDDKVVTASLLGDDHVLYVITLTTGKELTTGLENLDTTIAPAKAIVNGQLVIIKNGVQYNAQGAVVK